MEALVYFSTSHLEFRISKTPLEPDVLEHSRVTVKHSKAGVDAGEGLFAKVQFETDDLVAIYNGEG